MLEQGIELINLLINFRDDTNPYIQIDLGYADEIEGVATQGQEANYWFVRKFTLSFSLDGTAWFNYTENGLGTKVRETNILALSLHSKFRGQFRVQCITSEAYHLEGSKLSLNVGTEAYRIVQVICFILHLTQVILVSSLEREFHL